MKINILSQGITPDTDNSVGNSLIKLLGSDEYHTFTGISAFASEAGINGIAPYIERAKEKFECLNIIVGVDQKGTSREALYSVLKLGINSLIFYQAGHSIFHPKIYLFEGKAKSQLIIGSSNLTAHGLFVNVESSVHLELLHGTDDESIIAELKERFSGLFDFSDPNLQKITADLIESLVNERIVPTEAERRESLLQTEPITDEKIESIVKKLFPKRNLPSIPSSFRKRLKANAVPLALNEDTSDLPVEDVGEGEGYTLVWTRRRLPASSVEIAGSANTNPTGGLRLVQDNFQVDGQVINQTTYFRNEVFGDLNWATEKQVPLVEVAIATFEVIVLEENLGVTSLRIRHKPSGEAGQHNYTTLISWGDLSKKIQERNLTGRSLSIYRLDGSNDTFRLEIQ